MGEKMVDKVVRLMKSPANIRNIAICAHIDHGKSTFSDNLLAGAGMMSEHLAGKARVTDFAEDEKERGITIDTAAVSMVHTVKEKEYLINLLDTPGHVDFGGDVTRAMRAVDGAVTLICAVEGIMPQTETVLRQALKERVRPVLFINKVDRLIKELQLTPEAMQQRFMKQIEGVNELIKKIAPKEYGDKWQVSVLDGTVAFGSAFHNWALSIPFMKKHNITFKEVIDAYKAGDDSYKILAKKAPIHKVILDMVVDYLPDPIVAQKYRIPRLWHGDLESTDGKSLLNCDPNGPLFFCITKVIVDTNAGEISCGRLFSGTMTKGTQAYLNRAKQKIRIQQVYVFNGAKRDIVDNVPSGNIIGVAGLRSPPGETITIEPSEPFEAIQHIFEPVITKAIKAKRPQDLPRLIEILRLVVKKDPTIKIEIDEETGQHLMHGMGELHLEVIENRITNDNDIEIETSPPIVVYREGVTKASVEVEGKSPNKHNKFYISVEPLAEDEYAAIKSGEIQAGRKKKKDQAMVETLRDLGWDTKAALKVKEIYEGNMLIDATRGIVAINEVMELIMDMFEEVMRQGPVAREPCVKLKVILHDCKLHEDAIHRGPGQVYPAVRQGIKDAIMAAGPVLYEPKQVLQLEAPTEYTGELSKIVNNSRGQLLDMDQDEATVTIKAKLPVAEMFGWSSALRSATGGRGISSLMDQMFERLTGELAAKVIQKIRTRKGLSESQV